MMTIAMRVVVLGLLGQVVAVGRPGEAGRPEPGVEARAGRGRGRGSRRSVDEDEPMLGRGVV